MRLTIGAWVAITIGIFAFTAASGLTDSILAAAAIGVLITGLAAIVLRKFSILDLHSETTTRGMRVLSIVAILVGLFQLARLTVFIIEPSKTNYSTIPFSTWEIRHCCLTAYYVASRSVGQVPDIYDNSLYTMPDDDPTKIRKARMIDSFNVDVYHYPPPFLLLPRTLSLVAPDFLNHRNVWIGLNGLIAFLAVIVVASSLKSEARSRAIILAPLIFAALPTLNALQKGNVQLLIIALVMISMVLLSKQRILSGGLILAYATASKIYPGMLLVYLMVRRQWRAVVITAALGIALALIAFVIIGWDVYRSFLHHLPGILGGEGFPAFRNPSATAINLSIPGLVFKLRLFGVPGMTFGALKIVGWIYTLILLAIIGIVAHRSLQKEDTPLVWLAILIFATLRSPFLPQAYGIFPAIWLLTLVVAHHTPGKRTFGLLILGWLALNIIVPTDLGIDPWKLALINAIPQSAMITIAMWSLWHWHRTPVERSAMV